MIYYNSDKRFLVLVIYVSLLYFISFFFFQKAENNWLKRSKLAKIWSVGPVDQQINLVSPKQD